MPSIAVLVGNVAYQNLQHLDCCGADVLAMSELLEATKKYELLEVIVDATADDMRERIRALVSKTSQLDEFFFYFTGHGIQTEDDFYYCGTNFDHRRPNETGLSTDALHQLLKLADANLVVKVVDACNSGTLLVKDGAGFAGPVKHGFKNLVQISSCLDSQNSLTGHPLSLFTDFFRRATLRKKEGTVYYTDVIAALRDEFLNNTKQTPHFVSQSDAREVFVSDASLLDNLRAKLSSPLALVESTEAISVPTPPPTLVQALEATEKRIVTPEKLAALTGTLFDQLKTRIQAEDISKYFDVEWVEHSSFEEATAKAFMVRVLARQKRPDDFVTAAIHRKRKRNNRGALFGIASLAAQFSLYGDDDDIIETWDLNLNCRVDRAQARITLTPKFMSLKKIVLVVTCAPSIESCYIFEVSTEHARQDFHQFDEYGSELSTRWWEIDWAASTAGIVEQLAEKLHETVETHLAAVSKRLSGGGS